MNQSQNPVEEELTPKPAPSGESRGLLFFTVFLLFVLWLLVLSAHV